MSYDVEAVRRAYADPHVAARLLGLEVAKGLSPRSRVVRCRCPWHADRAPSCDLQLRDGVLVAFCRSCSQGGDALSLVAAVEGLDARADFRVVVERAAERAGVVLHGDAPPRGPRPPPRDPLVVAREELREARRRLRAAEGELADVRELLADVAQARAIERGMWRALLQGARDVIAELQARLDPALGQTPRVVDLTPQNQRGRAPYSGKRQGPPAPARES